MHTRYTSALRINSANVEDLEKNLDCYQKAFDEVFFFSQFTHSVKSLSYHQKQANILKPYLDMVKSKQMLAGINVLTTIGFFSEDVDPDMRAFKPYVTMEGDRIDGKLCPSSKKNIQYYQEQYRIYARLHPDVIYIDDDISSLACACDCCVKRFFKQYPEFKILTRKQLYEQFNSTDTETRTKLRTAWIQYNAQRIGEVYHHVETAVHEIDPKITLGAMTHMSGTDGLDCAHWAEMLAAKETPEIYWRPGGGVYTDFHITDVLDKANRISMQIRDLPAFANRIESEIENFPYQSLKKSPSFTVFESFIYQAAGCTGTAYNVLSKEEMIGEEHEKFFEMAENARSYSTLLTSAFGTQPLSGAGFWWDQTSAAYPAEQKWNFFQSLPQAQDLHLIGIPYACDPEHMQVFFMDQNTALHIPEKALMECLSKGVLLDANALDVLNNRGFGEYTGFQTTGVFTKDTLEQELEHPLNMPGRHRRNIRQGFVWSIRETYTIEKTDEKAEYTAENRDLSEHVRGMSAGIFENKLGGRIAVDGISPFQWCFSLPRNIHTKNTLRWLSKNTLPAYVSSFHRVSVWVRGNAYFAANFATESAKNVELSIKTDAETICATISCGSSILKTETIRGKKNADGYTAFLLDELPTLGTALITLERNQ